MTVTEKILAAHCGRDHVKPGELIDVKLDFVFAHDVSAPIAIREFQNMGYEEVFDRNKVGLIMDHFTPNANLKAAEQCKYIRAFARKNGIKHFFDLDTAGIEHALIPEQGLALPGEVIVGGDSHTCTHGALGTFATGMGSTDIAAAMALGEIWFKVPETLLFVCNGQWPEYVMGKDLILDIIAKIGVDGARYKAMELCGTAISDLSMDGRFSICNMAVEAGAKNAIIEPDEKTLEYVKQHNYENRPFHVYKSDPDSQYSQILEYDVSQMEPVVAYPHLPSNIQTAGSGPDIPLDQVVIGSCTNGRMEDLRAAATILKNRKIHPQVRTIIVPATRAIYMDAVEEGLVRIFMDAGAVVSPPACGSCFGGHLGVLASGERCLSTTNRNFVGRMGSSQAEIYLSNPYVAAASAVAGKIVHPKEVG